MAAGRASSCDGPSRARRSDTQVGCLMRHDRTAAAKGQRPPRTPLGHCGLPRPCDGRIGAIAAAALGRPNSARQERQPLEELARADVAAACGRGGSRGSSPAPADQERPRIVGAFRACPAGRQALRPSSRGRSPSCGPSDCNSVRGSSAARGRDIIAENRAAAGRPRRASSAGAEKKEVRFACGDSGVPLYLQWNKAAVASEERAVAERLGLNRSPDGAPPGFRLLTDSERQEMLDGLQKKKAGLDAQYSRMPLHLDTQAQKQRAQELERALKDVESNLGKFSQPKVLIKI